jgi:beta-phosphoglucomutase-like phosphatase (HAD superfamily)
MPGSRRRSEDLQAASNVDGNDTLKVLLPGILPASASASSRRAARARYREFLGSEPFVDTIASGEDAGEGKPAPGTPSHAKAAWRVGMRTSRC